ncbi:Guanine nucleotide-binding protein subunit beta-like protein 1 [Tupaia chinensis]|uniref:Guanine nucleotide-binding protein subunit beta-like protein 1 n=1 Tax=Tupaia chinensis TaxID=246437 RepID=L9KPK3_TUPCH|nr:Guanine nucleotide-binding protein subunit beta-like protein 1 [Tupaia chinensis]
MSWVYTAWVQSLMGRGRVGDRVSPSMAVPLPQPPPPPDPQFVLRGTQSAVHALHFCEEAQDQRHPLLFSGSQRGLVHIWNLQTRRTVAALDGHGGQCVTWLHTLSPGHQLLSQGRDLTLRLWDLAEGRNAVVDSVQLQSMGFCRSSVLAGGQSRWMLAVPGKDSEASGPFQLLTAPLSPQADCSPHLLLLAGYEDGSVALWDVSERKVCSRVACHEEPIMGLDFDSQKARGVSGSAGKALAVWSLDGQQALQFHLVLLKVEFAFLFLQLRVVAKVSSGLTLTLACCQLEMLPLTRYRVRGTHQLTNPGISDVTIRADRKILATAGWDHQVRVFHWRTMKPLAVLAFHSATIHCVAFATNGLLAAGSGDQRISVWSIYSRT